ncbi:hypothetical protein ACFQY8_07410 [Alloscardovia venturai]|uniref:Uncharacterized protein n=1 Tax=Alloscardovia venturai TaxID=1769421 RepID=A0ABW2Y5N3_9BIFI
MDDGTRNFDLLLECLAWLETDLKRILYFTEYAPAGMFFTRILLTEHIDIDSKYVDSLFGQAHDALCKRDFEEAYSALVELNKILEENLLKDVYSKSYITYLQAFIACVGREYRHEDGHVQLEALWFDMAHSWRNESAKGVPSIPDISQFMLIETITTIVLLILGGIIPVIQSPRIFKLIPIVMLLTMTGLVTACDIFRNTDWKWVFSALIGFIGLYGVHQLEPVTSRWILWSWAAGVIIGVLLQNHIAYKRSRRMANKYGPLACLWVRHVSRDRFEYLMVKTDGSLAWHYTTPGWFKNIDPLLGNSQAIDYRGDTRNKGYSTSYRPDEGWFPCYPALVSTRMKGLQRWNPKDLEDAIRLTPELTPHMREEFFNHAPSIVTPPQEYVNTQATHIPRFTPIPW